MKTKRRQSYVTKSHKLKLNIKSPHRKIHIDKVEHCPFVLIHEIKTKLIL